MKIISDINELTGSDYHVIYNFTGSRKAKMILDDLNKYLPMFIKVIPYDYKKVLQEQKLEELKKEDCRMWSWMLELVGARELQDRTKRRINLLNNN
ncbi:MAG: hypothetical protein MZV63_37140 [Marinilabiliales bacterium]|nr:hypothetical protein [Marinilabiliales bacterium]